MSCQEFHENGWLFLSGELDRQTETEFRDHLGTCSLCREAFEEASSWASAIHAVPEERPQRATRRAILKAARVHAPRVSPWERWMHAHRTLSMGVPALAATALVIMILLRPWHQPALPLDWEGTLIDEITAVDRALDDIAGELDASALVTRKALNDWDEGGLSTMTQDIAAIQQDLEYLNKTDESL